MAKAVLKTRPTEDSVESLLEILSDPLRADCLQLIEMMTKITGCKPVRWGPAMIGFGQQHLVYASGRELDWFIVGFSPRKVNITIYLTPGFTIDNSTASLLGKFKVGKGCLYIKRLEDIDQTVLAATINRSIQQSTYAKH